MLFFCKKTCTQRSHKSEKKKNVRPGDHHDADVCDLAPRLGSPQNQLSAFQLLKYLAFFHTTRHIFHMAHLNVRFRKTLLKMMMFSVANS